AVVALAVPELMVAPVGLPSCTLPSALRPALATGIVADGTVRSSSISRHGRCRSILRLPASRGRLARRGRRKHRAIADIRGLISCSIARSAVRWGTPPRARRPNAEATGYFAAGLHPAALVSWKAVSLLEQTRRPPRNARAGQ